MFPAGYASAFWLPLVGVFLLLSGYWIGVWYKGRGQRSGPGVLASLGTAARSGWAGLRQRTGRLLGRLSLLPYWNRAMIRAANLLPTSVRFWFWVRCANDETDPGLWCKTLQFLSCRQLSLSPYAPLPEVAEKIVRFQPKSDPETVRQLFRELEGAIYGNQPIDFEQWKQDFQQQVRPSIAGLRDSKPPVAGDAANRALPELNPKAA